MSGLPVPVFTVIPGDQVRSVVAGAERRIIEVVEGAYRLHGQGRTVNPDSSFLRFPDEPANRIIALPASVGGDVGVHGIKWIASFPGNVAAGLPRASAVLLLNDPRTGYPFACIEGSIISAARTAASAALAAAALSDRRPGGRPRRVGIIGAGLIARYVHTYLVANGFAFDQLSVYDTAPESAQGLAESLQGSGALGARVCADAEEVIRGSDLVVFATVAAVPHIHEASWFDHSPLVLHVSLRDLDPKIVLGAYNITDDVEHCLKASTSPHLAEQLSGGREFIAGTLYDVLTGSAPPVPADRTVVFSPFGLGVLDLAVARYVHSQVVEGGGGCAVPTFFVELSRHGTA